MILPPTIDQLLTHISSTKIRPNTNQEFSPNFIESAEVLLLSPYIGGDTVQQHGWNAFLFDVDLFQVIFVARCYHGINHHDGNHCLAFIWVITPSISMAEFFIWVITPCFWGYSIEKCSRHIESYIWQSWTCPSFSTRVCLKINGRCCFILGVSRAFHWSFLQDDDSFSSNDPSNWILNSQPQERVEQEPCYSSESSLNG